MTEREFSISLRLCGDELMPDEISVSLGCEPSEARAKGDKIESKRFVRNVPTGVWILRSDNTEEFEKAVNELLDRVSSDVRVWSELTKRFRAEFFVGVFLSAGQTGVTVSSATLQRIGALGLSLALDIYCNASSGADVGDRV